MRDDLLFINVDTTKDFMEPEGKLYVPDANKIVENLRYITDVARLNGIKVLNTKDSHTLEDKEISNTPDFISTFPPHCLVRSEGAEFIEATNPFHPYIIKYTDTNIDEYMIKWYRNIVIEKNEFDAFSNKNLCKVLDVINPYVVCIYGVVEQICVNQIVMGLVKNYPQINIFCLEDAIKELPNLPSVKEKWVYNGVNLANSGYYERQIN